MDERRKNNFIIEPDKQMLTSYYGQYNSPRVVEHLWECYKKILNNTCSIVHTTTNLDNILKTGELLLSSGGLGGCLYGTPAYKDNSMHNLSEYIINNEIPMFLNNQNKTKKIDSICLVPKKFKLGCVDYLLFGEYYFQEYRRSSSLNSEINPKQLSKMVSQQTNIICNFYEENLNKSSHLLKAKLIGKAISSSLILKMLYFEVLVEYIFINQNDENVILKNRDSELYNKNVKELLFNLNPPMANRFAIANFSSNPNQVINYLEENRLQKRIITNFDKIHFVSYISNRLSNLVKVNLLENNSNLIGHILFRYFDKRKVFESKLANALYECSRLQDITVLSYRLPKGEIGVLPNIDSYFYLTRIEKHKYINTLPLNIRVSNNLIFDNTTMRDPYNVA